MTDRNWIFVWFIFTGFSCTGCNWMSWIIDECNLYYSYNIWQFIKKCIQQHRYCKLSHIIQILLQVCTIWYSARALSKSRRYRAHDSCTLIYHLKSSNVCASAPAQWNGIWPVHAIVYNKQVFGFKIPQLHVWEFACAHGHHTIIHELSAVLWVMPVKRKPNTNNNQNTQVGCKCARAEMYVCLGWVAAQDWNLYVHQTSCPRHMCVAALTCL